MEKTISDRTDTENRERDNCGDRHFKRTSERNLRIILAFKIKNIEI